MMENFISYLRKMIGMQIEGVRLTGEVSMGFAMFFKCVENKLMRIFIVVVGVC